MGPKGPPPGLQKKKKQHGGRKWWHALPVSEQDPISLEPLRRLRVEPFVIKEDGHDYRFDGRVLAAYLVSSQQFVNPLTRRELDLEICAKLDRHLDSTKCRAQSVARAWELRQQGASGERERLRTEAQAVMEALFAPQQQQQRTLRDGFEEDEVPLEDERPPTEELPQVPQNNFPALPEAQPNEDIGAWARQRAAVRPQQPLQRTDNRKEQLRASQEAEDRRMARMDRLAAAFGVSGPSAFDDVRWPADLMAWARGDHGDMSGESLKRLERRLAKVVDDRRPVDLPPMRDPRQRQHVKDLIDIYGLSADEFDADTRPSSRYLRVRADRRQQPRIPRPLLSHACLRAPPLPPPPPKRPPPVSSRGPVRRPGPSSSGPPPPSTREDDVPEPAATLWDLLNSDDDDDSDDATTQQDPPSSNSPRPVYESNDDECSICLCRWDGPGLDDGDDDDATPVVLQCGHKFHSSCLRNWSQITQSEDVQYEQVLKTTSCPQCRQPHTFARVPLPARRWSNMAAANT